MSAVTTVAAGTRLGRGGAVATGGRPRRRAPAALEASGATVQRAADGQTFDDLIVGAWEDLSAHRTVTCPVCHGAAMRPRYGAGGPEAVGGRCADCGSELG